MRRSEVADLLDLRQAMRVLEQTFRQQADGKVKQVPPLRFMNRGMRMVVGGLEAQNKNGFRVSVTGGESVALLFEISSGDLLAVMGYPFSNLRISATVGLAIDRLSSPNAKSIALIGSGRLAMPILEPAAEIGEVTVNNASPFVEYPSPLDVQTFEAIQFGQPSFRRSDATEVGTVGQRAADGIAEISADKSGGIGAVVRVRIVAP
jgi:hypothetical protein